MRARLVGQCSCGARARHRNPVVVRGRFPGGAEPSSAGTRGHAGLDLGRRHLDGDRGARTAAPAVSPRDRSRRSPERPARQAVLPLLAHLQDALSEFAVEALRRAIAHRSVRRLPDGRGRHRGQDARRAEGSRARAGHPRRLRLRQRAQGRSGARLRRRHAGHGVARPVPRRTGRRQRRLHPHRRT